MSFLNKIFKPKETKAIDPNYEKTNEIKKLSLFISIVPQGQANAIIKIFEAQEVGAQFVQIGEGTAQKEIRDILGIEDNAKEVVFSIIKDENIPNAKKELEAFFMASKRNKGVAFSIPFTSMIGVNLYEFLINKKG